MKGAGGGVNFLVSAHQCCHHRHHHHHSSQFFVTQPNINWLAQRPSRKYLGFPLWCSSQIFITLVQTRTKIADTKTMPWDRFMPFIQVLFIVLMKRFYSTSLCPWDLTSTLTRAKKLVIFVARTWQPASALFYQMEYIWGGWAGEQGVTKAEIRPARPNYGRKLAAKRRRCGFFGGANIYWRRMEIKVDLFQVVEYEGSNHIKNPEMQRVLLTHEVICR